MYDPLSGRISTYLNDRLVLTWRDPERAFTQGGYLSFRTGNAVVEFEDLRVYQMAKDPKLELTVGRNEMFRDPGPAKLLLLGYANQRWSEVKELNTTIR
ncbi:MAG: hypothetical protein AAF804_00190 [Bacteroidota bacterium]